MVFQPIEAFSVGRWQDAGGTTHDFPAEIVSQVAETYDTSRHRAAIVTNHSEQGPAKGFVKTLKFIDSKLFAEPENIEEAFKGEVDAGQWPNVSIRLYPPLHPNNPSPGKWSLRHLSYVVTGAVKGLATPALVEQAPAFAENKEGFVDLFLAFEDSTEASSAASESLAEAKADTDETPADDAPEAPADVGAEDVSSAGIPLSDAPSIESPIESLADPNDESLEHSEEVSVESNKELPPDDSPGDPPPNKETPMTIDEEKKVEAPGVVEPSDSDRQLLAEFAEAQAALVAEREKLEADKAEIAKFKAESLERTRKAEERLRIANAEIEAQKASLAAQKVAAAKEREDAAFCDQLSKEGKLTGEDDYAQVMAILKGPSLDKDVCFSDDEKDYTYPELLKDFLTRSLPVKVDFSEKSAGNNDSAKSGPMTGKQIRIAALKMVADAKAAGNDMEYDEAVNKISGGM